MGEKDESLRREVVRLTLPAVGEHLIRFSSGIVDTVLMGHLGAVSLAILGLSNQLFLFGAVFSAPIVVGSGVLVAQAIGAGDQKRAHRILGQAIWLGMGFGLSLMAVGLVFAPQALSLIGAEPDVVRSGTSFLRLLIFNLPIYFLVFAVNNCLRGAGDTRTPMYIIAVETGARILSAAFLVNGWGGVPPLGANGVAIGAIVGQLTGITLLFFWLRRGVLPLQLGQVPWAIDRGTIKGIMRLGIPSGGEHLALRLGQIANIRVLATLGTVSYAAYLVGFNAISVAFTVGVGFTVAATTIVGQRVGAGRPLAARDGAIQTWILAGVTMGIFGVVLALGARPIIAALTNEADVVGLAVLPLQIVAFILPAEATNQILSGVFRGAGDTRWPFLMTTAGNWLIRLPITLLVIGRFGLMGAWAAVMIEITVRAVINAWRFFRMDWAGGVQPVMVGVES